MAGYVEVSLATVVAKTEALSEVLHEVADLEECYGRMMVVVLEMKVDGHNEVVDMAGGHNLGDSFGQSVEQSEWDYDVKYVGYFASGLIDSFAACLGQMEG